MQPINAYTIVSKFDLYNIPLRSMELGESRFEYHLDNEFFKNIDGEEFQKGDITAVVLVNKESKQSELRFELEGKIVVTCDRCLEEMYLPIKTTGHLIVKMGKEYSDDGDEIVIIPEDKGVINVSWFMYEFVSLAIPIKHVHPYGLCNKDMSKKLREHLAVDKSEESDDDLDDMDQMDDEMTEEVDRTIDPRWATLKNLSRRDDNGED